MTHPSLPSMAQPPMDQHTLYKRVLAVLHRHAPPGERILVALSGGPDSVALVRVLARAAKEGKWTLGTAHLNHGYRGKDARNDQAFSRGLAKTLGLAFHETEVDVQKMAKERRCSLEEAGRHARYGFFDTLAVREGYTLLATGHHRDDHVEQVLMNLLRGSGPGGLTGIQPLRTGVCSLPVIRPLIRISKPEILAFLESLGQDFCLDATNADPGFRRNAVREHLLPLLESRYNPRIREQLDRLSRILSREEDFLNQETQRAFGECSHGDGKGISLSLAALNCYHEALIPRVLRMGLAQVKSDLKRITHTHIRDIEKLITQGSTGKHLDLPGRIRVYRGRDRIRICREALPLRELGAREKRRKAAKKKADQARKT